MAVTHISREEIEKIRGNSSANISSAPKKQAAAPVKNYIEMISDEQIARVFSNFGYLNHERQHEFIHVNCFDFDIFLNDFNLLSAKKQSPTGDQNIKYSSDFNYPAFECYCETAGISAEKAIYEYLYENILKNLPYYTERKAEFDQKMADNVSLATRKTIYGDLIKPAMDYARETSALRKNKKIYGSTDPEKIADVISRIKG